ncbi:hypothetical protein EV421DRAFT_1903852 [Armillaria borealis]|uniref:Uncharacterized protein n=1 Tax=Armillaria borealis TaxID=47425 RepID=A0AA39MQH6_9AGAR|nr:hypothetical protein EV421DRAFT_1903852 [Armillaria borealis]
MAEKYEYAQESLHISLSHAQSNGSLHQPTMLQNPQQLSASSSRETLSPNDGQLRRSASGSTHSIDIEVEPLTNRFLSPNRTPTILPPEPPDTEPPPGFMPYPSVFVSRPDKSPETPKTIPSADWGMDEWGNPPTRAAGSPWGGSTSALPAAPTSADPSPTQASISGFDASRTPTPRTTYESMSTLPGFTYPLPPGWTPSNPAHNYPLPTSSGKRSSTSSSAMSSSSMSSSRCGSQSHRSRRSAP